MGEKIKKNFKLKKLERPTKMTPVIPNAIIAILNISLNIPCD